jgi:hypothetical protein
MPREVCPVEDATWTVAEENDALPRERPDECLVTFDSVI